MQVSSSAGAKEGDVVLDAFSKQQRQYKVRYGLIRRGSEWFGVVRTGSV